MKKTKNKSKSVTFYCFSPAVMITTFGLEILLAFWTLFKKSKIRGLAVFTLVFLATFQLAEYNICQHPGDGFWWLPGLAAITLLPPLGLHIISEFTNRRQPVLFGYSLAAVFVALFALKPELIGPSICGGNYVIFPFSQNLGVAYGYYYFGLLFIGIYEALRARTVIKDQGIRNRLAWLAGGYLTFMAPTGLVYLIAEDTRKAVPSIMCGFAVIFAFVLAKYVAPDTVEQEADDLDDSDDLAIINS